MNKKIENRYEEKNITQGKIAFASLLTVLLIGLVVMHVYPSLIEMNMQCHAPQVDCAAGYISEGRVDDVQNGGVSGYYIGFGETK